MYSYFISFYGWIIFCRMFIPQIVQPSIHLPVILILYSIYSTLIDLDLTSSSQKGEKVLTTWRRRFVPCCSWPFLVPSHQHFPAWFWASWCPKMQLHCWLPLNTPPEFYKYTNTQLEKKELERHLKWKYTFFSIISQVLSLHLLPLWFQGKRLDFKPLALPGKEQSFLSKALVGRESQIAC